MSREHRALCRAGLLVIGVMFEHFSYPIPLLSPTGAFLGIGGSTPRGRCLLHPTNAMSHDSLLRRLAPQLERAMRASYTDGHPQPRIRKNLAFLHRKPLTAPRSDWIMNAQS